MGTHKLLCVYKCEIYIDINSVTKRDFYVTGRTQFGVFIHFLKIIIDSNINK